MHRVKIKFNERSPGYFFLCFTVVSIFVYYKIFIVFIWSSSSGSLTILLLSLKNKFSFLQFSSFPFCFCQVALYTSNSRVIIVINKSFSPDTKIIFTSSNRFQRSPFCELFPWWPILIWHVIGIFFTK